MMRTTPVILKGLRSQRLLPLLVTAICGYVCLGTSKSDLETEESIEAHRTVKFSSSDTSRIIELRANAATKIKSVALYADVPVLLREADQPSSDVSSGTLNLYSCQAVETCTTRVVIERGTNIGAFNVLLTGSLTSLVDTTAVHPEEDPLLMELHLDVVQE